MHESEACVDLRWFATWPIELHIVLFMAIVVVLLASGVVCEMERRREYTTMSAAEMVAWALATLLASGAGLLQVYILNAHGSPKWDPSMAAIPILGCIEFIRWLGAIRER